jgi:Na+-translocating ferredoxin:NAD+ oxidoreductase subunit E
MASGCSILDWLLSNIMHTLHNDPEEHRSEDPTVLWIFGACPLLAVTDTLTNALGICVAILIASVLGTAAAALLLARLPATLRLAATLILLAAIVGSLTLLANAWLPSLYASLGIFPVLIATNLLLISRLQLAATVGLRRALRQSMTSFAPVLLVLLILGTLRELVGRGSLLHDIGLISKWVPEALDVQLFTADLGFLLGLLPPGAFISFAVLLALRNWWRARTASAAGHGSDPSPTTRAARQ